MPFTKNVERKDKMQAIADGDIMVEGLKKQLQSSGIHLNGSGHRLITPAVLRLGFSGNGCVQTPDASRFRSKTVLWFSNLIKL